MTEGPDRPNFFVILGLDPEGPWDQAAFERSLTQHRSTWTRQRNGIRTNPDTMLARWCLSNFREIERVMRDPASRLREREAARQIRAGDRRRQHDDFVARLDLMLARGFLYDVELQALKAEMDAVGADAALRRRLDRAEVRSVRQARANQERLDSTTELVLKANLTALTESSLYTALATVDAGINEGSPRDKLLAAADALYRKAQNTADKTKPEVGAMQQLAGLARRIFSDDDLTRRYNLSMLLAPLDELAERYERDLALVRALDASQVERFLHTAAAKRIDPALAKEFLISYFGERNWTVELPGAASEHALRRLVSCPRCETLNEPDAPFCQDCGRNMREQCPRCGREVSAGTRVCPQCSFPTGQHDLAEFFVEEAESYLGRDDIAEATDQIIRAEQAWPTGADSKDDLAVRIRSARESITRLQAARDQEAKNIAGLMSDERYSTALLKLRGLTIPLPSSGALIAECERKVAQAHELFRAGEHPGTSDERKAELWLRALRICKDYEPARQGLESIPPPPPHDLRVTADEDRMIVRLDWEQDSPAGCAWVVVRAEGVKAPDSPADLPRQRVSRGLSSLSWTDPDPMIGAPVRYAVWSERSTVLSARAAIASDVVFLLQPSKLTIAPADRAVRLAWTLPPNALGVELQRSEAGSQVPPIHLPVERGQTDLVDRNVRNGVRYQYAVRARFADPTTGRQGDVRYSPAAEAVATPSPPPAPPRAPYAQGSPPREDMPLYVQKVELRWAQPERGVIKILRTGPDGALRPGDDLTEEQLARIDRVLDGPPPCYDTLRRHAGPFVQYFPVLAVDGRYYVGHPRRYLVGSEVTDLRAEYLSTSVRVCWTWPQACDEALVAWDEDTEVADPVASMLQARVVRGQGETTGQYDIPVHTAQKVFVVVAVVAQASGHEFTSSGAATTVPRSSVALRYEVRSGRGPGGRKGELVLKPGRPAWLPALEVRGRADSRPAGRNDPLLLELPPGRSERELIRKFALGSALPRSCRLFVAEDADSYGVHIVHPD